MTAKITEDTIGIIFLALAIIAYLMGVSWKYWGSEALKRWTAPGDLEKRKIMWHNCKVLAVGMLLFASAVLNTAITYLSQVYPDCKPSHVIVAFIDACVALGYTFMAVDEISTCRNKWSTVGFVCAVMVLVFKSATVGFVAGGWTQLQYFGCAASFFGSIGAVQPVLPLYEHMVNPPSP